MAFGQEEQHGEALMQGPTDKLPCPQPAVSCICTDHRHVVGAAQGALALAVRQHGPPLCCRVHLQSRLHSPPAWIVGRRRLRASAAAPRRDLHWRRRCRRRCRCRHRCHRPGRCRHRPAMACHPTCTTPTRFGGHPCGVLQCCWDLVVARPILFCRPPLAPQASRLHAQLHASRGAGCVHGLCLTTEARTQSVRLRAALPPAGAQPLAPRPRPATGASTPEADLLPADPFGTADVEPATDAALPPGAHQPPSQRSGAAPLQPPLPLPVPIPPASSHQSAGSAAAPPAAPPKRLRDRPPALGKAHAAEASQLAQQRMERLFPKLPREWPCLFGAVWWYRVSGRLWLACRQDNRFCLFAHLLPRPERVLQLSQWLGCSQSQQPHVCTWHVQSGCAAT